MIDFISKLRMPYDLYERHAVVVKLLDLVVGRELHCQVLDVGGRSELSGWWTRFKVISLNIDGSGDVLGSGLVLPFVDNAFAAVVSIDTLEHIAPPMRTLFVRECMRVARWGVIIAVPFGSEEHRVCEVQLAEFYRSQLGKPHPYLEEHIRYGLPDVAELESLCNAANAHHMRYWFAGNYMWPSRHLMQVARASKERSLLAWLMNKVYYVFSRALFHPIHLATQPYPRANRVYVLMEK